MTEDVYYAQMLRLTEVFGAKYYTTPRLSLIAREIKSVKDSVFERAVNRLIMTSRSAPMLLEIKAAIEAVEAEDKQRARESAPTVGLIGQLHEAAKKTSVDSDYVRLCMKTLDDFVSGKINRAQFDEACDALDRYALQINPKGERRDLVLRNGHWEFREMRA